MVESEKFFLQWREFEGNVRASYRTLLSSGDYSDVTLASRDGHRVTFSCQKSGSYFFHSSIFLQSFT